MAAIYSLATGVGAGLATGRRRRLPRWREEEIDREFAARGVMCYVCRKHIKKSVQVGSGWVSGFYIKCRNCGEHGFRSAHNYCVPWYLGNDSLIAKIVRHFRKDVEGYNTVLLDQCECCEGTDTLWILRRHWGKVLEICRTTELSPQQIDVALSHPHWLVRQACLENQVLSEEQIQKALEDSHPAVVEAAKQLRQQVE